MTMTDTPKTDERASFEPTGAGLGVWVITSFVALVALAVSIAALVISVSHQTKRTVTSTAAAPVVKTPPGTPTIRLREYNVNVGASTLNAGNDAFTIANNGRTEHEVLVFHTDLSPAAFPLDQEGNINEDAPGMNKVSDGENIAPGGTQNRTIDLTQPGTYVFVCNLPGHFKAGMYQVITVK